MRPYVVLSRLLPTYDFVAAVPIAPAEAQANVERKLSQPARFLTTLFVVRRIACLRATPLFWRPLPSIVIRFVPSVIGTNLHVRVSFGPLWWAIVCGSTLSSVVMGDGLAIAGVVVLSAAAVLFLVGFARAEQWVLDAFSG